MQQFLNFALPTLLFLTSVFLILLVLIQRGRGGGLAGAFGGMGGQSAFGTKAGDLFTRVTIVTATVWIILCAASVKVLNSSDSGMLDEGLGTSAPAGSDLESGAGGAAAGDSEKEAAESSDSEPAESESGAEAPAAESPAAEAPTGGESGESDAPADDAQESK
ncbi:MAG: preprotein translocase subunit SecG [Planctomycetota bacterium]|nr:MAG: preprotein translocase subunit SecG [Planctomycetota bacterium]